MTKKQNTIPIDYRVVWTISNFPLRVKNALAAVAKMKDLNIPDLMEEIVIKFIEDEGYKELLK